MNRDATRRDAWELRFLVRCRSKPWIQALRRGMALADSPYVEETLVPSFDFHIANVVSYDFLTIVVFACSVAGSDARPDPLSVACGARRRAAR
jgi:hypothetical protein